MTGSGRVWVGAVVLAGVVVLLGAWFVGWRVTTPAECLRVTQQTASWADNGIRPQPMRGCSDPGPLGLVTGAERTTEGVRLATLSGPVDVPVHPGGRQVVATLGVAAPTLAFVVGLFGLGCHAFALRPRDPGTGALLVAGAAMMTSSVVAELGIPPSAVFTGWARWLYLTQTGLVFALAWGASLLVAAVFPRTPPEFGPTRRHLVLTGPGLLVVVVGLVLAALAPGFTGFMRGIVQLLSFVSIAVLLSVITVIVIRVRAYRRPDADPVARQQLLWVGASFSASALSTMAFWFVPRLLAGHSLLPDSWIGAPGVLFVIGLGVAMLRYRMFNLDAVLTTALLYSALSVVAVSLYLGLIGLATLLLSGRAPVATTTVVAIVTAIALIPVRNRLQRAINRLLFGQSDEPFTALTRVAEQLSLHDRDLRTVAAELRRALRVPYVAVAGRAGVIAASGVPRENPTAIPLDHPGGPVGHLLVAGRGAGDRFSARELDLLGGLAHQIALSVADLQLTEELRASRERIVIAREEERRALRRTLHDELGPAVTALALRIETVRARSRGSLDPATDSDLAETAKAATVAARVMRSLSYDLRPPALDELGLVAAVRDFAGGLAGLRVEVDTEGMDTVVDPTVPRPAGSDRLPAATELAAYRIVANALANVSEHAEAQCAWVRLRQHRDRLEIAVRDDGVGIADGFRRGVGVTAMAERAEELGGRLSIHRLNEGGTEVEADLPLARAGGSDRSPT